MTTHHGTSRALEWVFTTRTEHEVSWFEPLPAISLEMLEAAGMTAESCVLDVGGGTRTSSTRCSHGASIAWRSSTSPRGARPREGASRIGRGDTDLD
jgi:hypothetical protein